MQERIAALRTALDSFSDAEAFALMTSGYRMTEKALAGAAELAPRTAAPAQPWRFLAVEKFMNLSKGHEEGGRTMLRLLEVGSQKAFKIWRLSFPLQVVAIILGVIAAAAFAAACWIWRYLPLLTLGSVGGFVLGLALTALLGSAVMRVANFRAELWRIVRGVALSLAGWLIAGLHLKIFDPLFLEAGKVTSLSDRPPR